MKMSALAKAAGGNMPLNPKEVLSIKVNSLSTAELNKRIDALTKLQEAVGLLRAKYLREIRNRDYPITGREGKEGDPDTPKGWKEYLTGKGLRPQNINAEIRGLESLEAAAKAIDSTDSESFGRPPADAQKPISISNSVLSELGQANGQGHKVATAILQGEISGKRAVRAAVQEANEQAKTPGVQQVKPPQMPPPPSPKLPMKPPPGGPVQKLSSYRNSPLATEQKEKMEKMVEKIRKCAVSYCNAVKSLETYTYEGKASDRRFPSHMTALAIVWKEQEFDLNSELQSITKTLSDANHAWVLAMEALNGEANILED